MVQDKYNLVPFWVQGKRGTAAEIMFCVEMSGVVVENVSLELGTACGPQSDRRSSVQQSMPEVSLVGKHRTGRCVSLK